MAACLSACLPLSKHNLQYYSPPFSLFPLSSYSSLPKHPQNLTFLSSLLNLPKPAFLSSLPPSLPPSQPPSSPLRCSSLSASFPPSLSLPHNPRAGQTCRSPSSLRASILESLVAPLLPRVSPYSPQLRSFSQLSGFFLSLFQFFSPLFRLSHYGVFSVFISWFCSSLIDIFY